MEHKAPEKKEIIIDDSEVIGIGPFSEELLPYLDYPEDYYKNIDPGTFVLVSVFKVFNNHDIRSFCDCVSITDCTDLTQAIIQPEKINEEKLKLWAGNLMFDDNEIQSFLFLVKQSQWKMFYHPSF